MPAVDTHLVYDAAGNRWVSYASSDATTGSGDPSDTACEPQDPVWTKGFAHVPYRRGPAADGLVGCWEGDALPNGGGSWAANDAGSVGSPSVAFVDGAWWMFFSARLTGSQQRCIGTGAGGSPTGPSWFMGAQPDICPANGSSAIDPELFYDRQTDQWYLLWAETDECTSRIYIDLITFPAGLAGSPRLLLDATQQALGFDEVDDAPSCPGGVRHTIESPTMVRADDGDLWLFFSGNDRDSVNYATGWGVCGSGSPVAGGQCALVSSFDPQGRYRPTWGYSERTAPAPGVDASPYAGFPDLPGFGGLSLATTDPTATDPLPVYATAQAYVDEQDPLPTPVALRLDTSQIVPALYETETVTAHGAPGTFGTLGPIPGQPAPTALTGHSLATRSVPGFEWPAGVASIFAAVADDGTNFAAGHDQNHSGYKNTADGMTVGAYDPAVSTWTNIDIRTSTGSTTVTPWTCTEADDPPACEAYGVGGQVPAGASAADVSEIDDGEAIAFTSSFGHPSPYLDQGTPPEGVWPVFGIVSKVDGEWQVASGSGWKNQWTGGELAQTVPRDPGEPNEPSISEVACPPSVPHIPAGESACRGFNELEQLPDSGQLIVAQYYGQQNPVATTGLTALQVTGPDSNGQYDVEVTGHYELPTIPHPSSTDPDEQIVLLAKEIQVDPTGEPGDERFTVVFDLLVDDDDELWTFQDPFFYEDPGPMVEFSFDATTGTFEPVSGPIVLETRETDRTYTGTGQTRYDADGNLWIAGRDLAVFPKVNGQRRIGGPECAFDQAWEDFVVHDDVLGRDIWGQPCRPDYLLLNARMDDSIFDFYTLTSDPDSQTMALIDSFFSRVLAIRYSGEGTNMTFDVSNALDTTKGQMVSATKSSQRGVFDDVGRLWSMARVAPGQEPCATTATKPWWDPRCLGTLPYQSWPQWAHSVDLEQLFTPSPMVLPTASQETARVQAEQNRTNGTIQSPGSGGTALVETVAHMRRCASCEGYMLTDADGSGHSTEPVAYTVYAPTPGSYQLSYRIQGGAGAQIRVQAGSQTATTSASTGNNWSVVTGPTVQLAEGTNTLLLSPSAGEWNLDWFELRRV